MTAPPREALDEDLLGASVVGQLPSAPGGEFQMESEEDNLRRGEQVKQRQQRVVESLLEIFRRNVERRWATDRNTYLNEAFDKDNQFVEFDPSRRQVVILPAPIHAVRRTFNLVKPYNRTMESRLTKGHPTYQVAADQADSRSEDAAELGNDLIPWIEKVFGVEQRRAETAFWLQRAGSCVWFNLLDYEDGPKTVDPDEGPTDAEPQGLPYSDVHPPHEVWVYPFTATHTGELTLIGRIVRMSKAEAISQFPDLKEAAFGDGAASDAQWGLNTTRAIRDMAHGQHGWRHSEGFLRSTATAVGRDEDDEVALLEVWIRKNGVLMDPDDDKVMRFPEGLHAVFAADETIGRWEPHTLGTRRHPLPGTLFRHSQSAGFWAASPCTPLRPIQQALNWALSLFEENILLAGRPVMLWPKRARAAWRRLQDFTMKILQYRPDEHGAKPEFLNPPNFPTNLPQLIQELLKLWQDVSGVHEVSRGQLPAAGISGVAIQLLQDQDDSQVGTTIREIEDGLANVVEQHLENIRVSYELPVMTELAGGSSYQARLFQGSDLGLGVRISVVRGSALPKAPAALEAKANELWAAGALLDEYQMPDWRRLQDIMGLASRDLLYDEMQQDKNNAALEEEFILGLPRELAVMALVFLEINGQLPMDLLPKPHDDAIVHEQRHKRSLKRIRERELSGRSEYPPENVQLLELHWQFTVPMSLMQRQGMPPMMGFGGGAAGGGGPAEKRDDGGSGPNGGKPAVDAGSQAA